MKLTITDKGAGYELVVEDPDGGTKTTAKVRSLADLLLMIVRHMNPGVQVRANENMIDFAGQTYDRVEWWH